MKKPVDFLFDLESLSTVPESAVVELSIVPFYDDPLNPDTFETLIKRGKKFKLDIASQKGYRHFMPSTIEWWKTKSPEAKANLKPAPGDLTVSEAVTQIMDFFKEHGANKWNSQLWCRGMSFDIPIFINMLREAYQVDDTSQIEPIAFWNGRDVRTAIEAIALTRGLTMTPLRKGLLPGFVAHDSIHDCAKDILMLQYVKRYAMGIEVPPTEEEADPETIKKRM